ncbi:MAG: TauD/TfdA family dioxygenase [Burkholderiales bacterium]|nr:TauD/TfdA family dioxygenase [Burkholderiales bacterium]
MNSQDMKPYDHPSAWRGADLRRSDQWLLRLSAADNDELQAALAIAKARGASIPNLTADDFPLPTLGGRIAAMLDDLVDGRGFTLVRGFDIHRHPIQDAALIYWGLGAHMGVGRAQNAQGELLGHVTDLGVDYHTDAKVRGYQTRLLLPFHNDTLDLVGLLCVHPARRGGLSRIVSSTAIHNAVLARRPDLLDVMYQPFHTDRRGEEPPGKPPYYTGAFFEWQDGRLFCRYNRSYIESAQRFAQLPRLSARQVEALDLMDSLCNDPEFHLDMNLEPGDMQFICNYTTLHSRTDYEDWPERERRRYLLRLWLETGRFPRRPRSFLERQDDMLIWQQNPQPPVFDLSMRRAELAH